MSVPTAYLTSTKNTAAIFDALQRAAVPETFSYEFLKQLGFASSSDRATIPVLKALTFLDQSNKPTEMYRRFKDKNLAGSAVAEGMRVAYADVFAVDTEAHAKPANDIAGIFSRLSDKGETVTSKMATTFKFLSGIADFKSKTVDPPKDEVKAEVKDVIPKDDDNGLSIALRHDIHVHLPVSTDVAVYDAIFKSIKANL